MSNKSPQEPKPSISGELDELVMLELRDVARKAQVDYVAVNRPNGIRSGEDPELLGEFLKVNHERILAAITSHMQAGFEYVIMPNEATTGQSTAWRGDGKNDYDIAVENKLKDRQRELAAEWLLGSKEKR